MMNMRSLGNLLHDSLIENDDAIRHILLQTVARYRGAVALLVPGLASIAGLWLGATMVGAVATHLALLHTNPAPAVILGLLNALVVYLRRDELKALLQRVNG